MLLSSADSRGIVPSGPPACGLGGDGGGGFSLCLLAKMERG